MAYQISDECIACGAWLLAGTSCVLRYISWKRKQDGTGDQNRRDDA